jgi:hypothetical protein
VISRQVKRRRATPGRLGRRTAPPARRRPAGRGRPALGRCGRVARPGSRAGSPSAVHPSVGVDALVGTLPSTGSNSPGECRPADAAADASEVLNRWPIRVSRIRCARTHVLSPDRASITCIRRRLIAGEVVGGAGGNRTLVRQTVTARATTIPVSLAQRLPARRVGWARGPDRLVFPRGQRSFTPSGVSPSCPPPLLLPGCGGQAPGAITGPDDTFRYLGTRRRGRTAHHWQLFGCPV